MWSRVINYGRIIPKQELDHIFQKIFTGQSSRGAAIPAGRDLDLRLYSVGSIMDKVRVKSDLQGTSYEWNCRSECQRGRKRTKSDEQEKKEEAKSAVCPVFAADSALAGSSGCLRDNADRTLSRTRRRMAEERRERKPRSCQQLRKGEYQIEHLGFEETIRMGMRRDSFLTICK
ncbi:MAG: hypothetical protein ACLTZM_02490 [Ruminococcus sp.]